MTIFSRDRVVGTDAANDRAVGKRLSGARLWSQPQPSGALCLRRAILQRRRTEAESRETAAATFDARNDIVRNPTAQFQPRGLSNLEIFANYVTTQQRLQKMLGSYLMSALMQLCEKQTRPARDRRHRSGREQFRRLPRFLE